MPTPLENWFTYLMAVHDRVVDLSQLAESSLRVFEDQKPADVIPSDAQRDNLSDLLLRKFNQTIPRALFQVATFRDFVNFLATDRDQVLQSEFRRVAVSHQPTLFDLSMRKFVALKVTEAFPGLEARTELFEFVDANSPTEFFSSSNMNRERFEALLTGDSILATATKGCYKQAAKTA
jgi:hypothetical protein